MKNKSLRITKDTRVIPFTKRLISILGLVTICFLPSAGAFVPGVDRYELSVGADFPAWTGVQARYNWSTRYYTKAGAGFAIELFMNTQQHISDGLGFNQNTAFVSKALVNSVVFDLRMGWAMSIYEGPYLELAYKLMIWGKGEVTGQDIKTHLGSSGLNIDDNSMFNEANILNHGPAFHIGYRFFLVDKLTLSMELGVYKPLFSHVTLNYGNVAVPAGSVDKIKTIILQDLWFLTGGLWLGVSF